MLQENAGKYFLYVLFSADKMEFFLGYFCTVPVFFVRLNIFTEFVREYLE
jgi:hypothetical protein